MKYWYNIIITIRQIIIEHNYQFNTENLIFRKISYENGNCVKIKKAPQKESFHWFLKPLVN